MVFGCLVSVYFLGRSFTAPFSGGFLSNVQNNITFGGNETLFKYAETEPLSHWRNRIDMLTSCMRKNRFLKVTTPRR